MLRYFNFEPNFKLQWCCAQDLFGSQVPVTTERFELQISCCKVANSGTPNPPNLLGLMA